MAMTKKEKAEMMAAIEKAELLAALRWTALAWFLRLVRNENRRQHRK